MQASIGLVGYGRFGKLWATILAADYKVYAYDINEKMLEKPAEPAELELIGQQTTIFLAVPIRALEATLKRLLPSLSHPTTVIDLCSVKVYPADLMQKYLPDNVGMIATHPLFGPDSWDKNPNPKIMMYKMHDKYQCYSQWKNYFASKNMHILEMTPDEHDRAIAKSHIVAALMGRTLNEYGLNSTELSTYAYEALQTVIDQTMNDSPELMSDMLKFNPYTRKTSEKLYNALMKIFDPIAI